MNYTIDKTHIDQLTSEQKQKLQELYPPKIGQKIITGKTGKNYVVKEIMRDGKLYVGSFKTWPNNVFPVLTESDLIHALSFQSIKYPHGLTINDYSNNERPLWAVSANYRHDGPRLIDALWDAFIEMVLIPDQRLEQ